MKTFIRDESNQITLLLGIISCFFIADFLNEQCQLVCILVGSVYSVCSSAAQHLSDERGLLQQTFIRGFLRCKHAVSCFNHQTRLQHVPNS